VRPAQTHTTSNPWLKATPIIAIIALATLEGVAIAQGVNGATLSLVITAIAGLGGYHIHGILSARRK